MRGVTLLELLVGITIFSVIVFLTYHTLERQRNLLNGMESRARPENESNYRLLVIKHFLEHSSERFRTDPFLESAGFFFPDLSFGSEPDPAKFSAAVAIGQPMRFVRSGSSVLVALGSPVEKSKAYLLAGADSDGNFAWSYDRCAKVSNSPTGLILQLQPLQTSPSALEKGTLMEAEIHGFVYQNNILYWISPGGAMQPYFSNLDAFEYTWNKPILAVRWQKGEARTEFLCEP
jgi:prepilin-type N-terminal cleavage/methylation domain-containing protein